MAKRQTITLLALAGVMLSTSCSRPAEGNAPVATPQAMPVKVETAKLQRVGEYTDYLATLKSRNSAVIQPQVEGDVTRIFVKSGDHVEAGAPLLQIDPTKQQATVHSTEANHQAQLAQLEYNRTELERRKKLYAAGVISKQDLDQAQTAYDASVATVRSLEASVREQQVQLHYYTVNAPAAGTIGDIPVRVGDRVTVSTTLTTLDKTGELEAYISIPAEKSGEVKVGTPVDLLSEVETEPTHTKLSFVSPRVDPASQLLLVKAWVPNGDHKFRNDQVVHAHVIFQQLDKPVVPVVAVSRMGGQIFAFVAEGQGSQTVAKQRPIKVGDVVGNNYVVLDGLKPGDRIITTGVQVLVDGMPVAPQS
ncbi:MAG TPA: efflux RND transporter periplasmic adaptor subunit [Terriglobales bacterium]|nr:efflux RND transporter periplasmic adaptor subunit [Terriglobales bacterium]